MEAESGEYWTQATSDAAFPARYDHASLVFDNKMWILGGGNSGVTTGTPLMNDVWSSMDGATWTQVSAAAPWTARGHFASVVFDNKMWVMGGYDGSYENDVWYSSDGITWTKATSSAAWSKREGLVGLVYNNKMWILGGSNATNADMRDVWYSSDGITWDQATSTASWIGFNQNIATVYDNKMWVVGINGYPNRDGVFSSTDGITWNLINANAPFSGSGIRAEFPLASFDNKLWVTGGWNGTNAFNEVWSSSDGATWNQVCETAPWDARSGQSLVTYNSRLWAIGGEGRTTINGDYGRNDVWYTSNAGSPSPTITGIIPSTGLNSGTVTITNLSGSGFANGATVSLVKTGETSIPATNVVVVSSNKITCTFDLTGAVPGLWNVEVQNPGSPAVSSSIFTVILTTVAPSVDSIAPALSENTDTVSITNLVGTGFLSGATVKLTKTGQSDLVASSVSVISSNQITCRFNLNGAATGTWDVVVTNPDAQTGTLTNAFFVYSSDNQPIILKNPLIHYYQNNNQIWSSSPLADNPATSIYTIGEYGCALTSAAMVLDYYGADYDPGQLNITLLNTPCDNDRAQCTGKISKCCFSDGSLLFECLPNVKKTDGTSILSSCKYEAFSTVTDNDLDRIDEYIQNDIPVIAKVQFSGYCESDKYHFLVIKGYEKIGDKITYLVNDPYYLDAQRKSATELPDSRFCGYTNGVKGIIKGISVCERASASTSTSGGSDSVSSSGVNEIGLSSASTISVNVGGNSAVSQVSLTGTGTNDAIVTAMLEQSLPESVPSLNSPVYQYIEITPTRVTTISSAEITFTVPQSWLDEHHVTLGSIYDPCPVVLERYHDGQWTTLPTQYTGNVYGTPTFTAQSPGFSTFAITINPNITTMTPTEQIGGNLTQVTLATTPTQISHEVTQVQSNIYETNTNVSTSPENMKKRSAINSEFLLIVGCVGCIGLIGGGLLIRRWLIHRQNPALFKEYK